MKKIKDNNKRVVRKGLVVGLVICLLFVFMTFPHPVIVLDDTDDGLSWHVLWKFNSAMAAEANPGSGQSGWLATFCLDYAETPGTCLASNATNGTYDTWGNVSGYVNTDNTDTDLLSEDPFYFVIRGRFNDTVKSGGNYQDSRCRVDLTVSGDETIADVTGTRVVSRNVSSEPYIYINFYWDDAVDGYRITDDGSLAWNCTIYAKY